MGWGWGVGGVGGLIRPVPPPPISGRPLAGTHHYAEFNVPPLPTEVGPTFFVYYK